MTNIERQAEVTSCGLIRRMILEPPVWLAADYKLIDENHHFREVVDTLAGGTGVLIGFNHPTKRDILVYVDYALALANRVAIKTGFKRNIEMTGPGAWHQVKNNKYEKPLKIAEKVFQGTIWPIVIDDTIILPEYEDLPLNKGWFDYLKNLVRVIQVGGIGVFSLQGGRKTSMEQNTRALSSAISVLSHNEVTNIAVHFVGISLPKVVPPRADEDLLEWNFGLRYAVRPGNIYTFEQLDTRFQLSASRDNYKNLDEWGMKETADLVQ